jgi:hypothetical protein
MRRRQKIGLLRDVVGERERQVVVRRQNPGADLTVVLVDHEPIAVEDVDLGMLGEVTRYARERLRQQQVVGIQPAHNLAARV